MRKKAAYFVLTVIVALAASFVVRHRTLNALRADNDSLRSQIDLDKSARPAALPDPPANSVARLNDADEKELLQLRSKIVPLREQLRDASNRVVILQRPRTGGASSVRTASEQATSAVRKTPAYNYARGLAEAVAQYAEKHGGKLPDDLALLEREFTNMPAGFSQGFELMGTNPLPEELRSFSLVAREKQAEQVPDIGWMRIYFIANGQVKIAGPLPENDWAGFESHFAESAKAGGKN